MDNVPLKYYNNLKLLSQYNDQLEKISYSLRIESGIYIFIAKEILNKYNSSFTRINFLILIISSIITFLESIKLIIQRMIDTNNLDNYNNYNLTNTNPDKNSNIYIIPTSIYYYENVNSIIIISTGVFITLLTSIIKFYDYQNKIEIASNSIVKLHSYSNKKVYIDVNRILIMNKWNLGLKYFNINNENSENLNIVDQQLNSSFDSWLLENKVEYLECDIKKLDDLIKITTTYIEKIREETIELNRFLSNKEYYEYKNNARRNISIENERERNFEFNSDININLDDNLDDIIDNKHNVRNSACLCFKL
jgi:hypothetical protein